VVQHCHSGRYVWGHEKVLSAPGEPAVLREFRDRAYGRPYAEELARKGYVVVVTDAFYFGERRLKVEDLDPAAAPGDMRESLAALVKLERATPAWLNAVNALCGRYEHLTAKTIFSAGATWPGMLVWDDMRAVDYLASRPEVDAKRIGALGLSIGGLRTARLAAADARVKVACVTGWMTEFHAQLRNHLRNHTWMAYIPGLRRSLDLPDEVALTVPGALLVQQCGRDALYPVDGMRGAVDKLTKIYAKAGIPERFKGTFYDVPHSFRPEMQEEAFAWIARWI
jgi:dienelactone hydrolase